MLLINSRRSSFMAAVWFLSTVASTGAQTTGTLYFSQDSNGNGLYALNTATGAATLLGASGVTNSTVGLAESDVPGVLYGSTWQDISRINADGSGVTVLPSSEEAEGLAYDPSTDTLYGTINTDFFIINQATGVRSATLATIPQDADGLAFGNGFVYGLEDVGNALYRYAPGLDAWTFVGATGVDFDNPGLAYNPILNVLYAVGDTFGDNLYSLNPATGAATLIGPTGLLNTAGGLAFIPIPEPESIALVAVALLGVARRRRV